MLTAADAQAWLDGLMDTALQTGEVPGAVVVIVKARLPHRLFDAGTAPGYSNYATAVAGSLTWRSSAPGDGRHSKHKT